MTDVTVGHTVTDTIVYLDQNGNPMLTPVVPDSPPAWTNAPNPADCDAMSVSADGSTATITTSAPGSDTIGLSVTVGGKQFSASQTLNIQAAPQVLSSVAIAAAIA